MADGKEVTQWNAGRLETGPPSSAMGTAVREDFVGARQQSAVDSLRNDQDLMDDDFDKQDRVMANTNAYTGTAEPTSGLAADTEDVDGKIADARAQVEETRSHLSATIDALKDKLSPTNLVEEAKEATIGKAQDAVSSVVDSVKDKASSVVEAVTGVFHTASDKVTDFAQGVSDKMTGSKDTVPATPTLTFYGSGDKNIGATIVDTIKLNPVPAAIAGFGLGWLLLSMQRQQNKSSYSSGTVRDIYDVDAYGSSTPYGTGYSAGSSQQFGTASNAADGPGLRDRASDLAHNVSDKASGLAQSVTGKASDLAGTVSDKASDLAQTVSGKASDLAQTVTGKASDLKDRASDWAGGVRDTASQFKDKAGDTVYNLAGQTKAQAGAAVDTTQQFVSDQPLAAAAIALIIGTAVGLALPSTRKENEVFGPQRDRLIDQGKDAAQNVANKVQNVASVALGQARDSISQTVDQTKQQLSDTVDKTKQQLSDTVQHAKDTVVSEAQNQGLTSSAS